MSLISGIKLAAEKLLCWYARTLMLRTCACDEFSRAAQQEHTPAGCSKRRPSHPPNPGAPRRAVPRRKAAAIYHLLRGGWDDPNCAQYSTHPALSAPRRALSRARAFQFPIPPFKGVAKAALNCAHRTSTVSPCAFCEQGGHLAAPCPSFGGRALREHRDRPSYPAPIFQHSAQKP